MFTRRKYLNHYWKNKEVKYLIRSNAFSLKSLQPTIPRVKEYSLQSILNKK